MAEPEQEETGLSERKKTDRLTDLGVRNQKKAGLYHDGRGLYLQVTSTGAKTWVLRYMLRGKAREMGLGSYQDISLADARENAKEARRLRKRGVDPIDHRRAENAAKTLEAAKTKTFAQCMDEWLDANADGWGARHLKKQRSLMAIYAVPTLGALPIAGVDSELVLKILRPIWTAKAVTARRVRDNIEAILDYARANDYRTGENPARWRGHLQNRLPKRNKKLHKVEHYAALPYTEIGAFMAKLRAQEGRDANAMEFAILTAVRVSEIAGARWDEMDLGEKVWTIAGERMKSGEEHRAPLSGAAIAVLERIEKRIEHRTGLLFPRASDKSLQRLRQRMGYDHITTHGFRSTFRDWAAERTNFPREIAEKALAHVVGDETERAYQRGDLLDKRRKLMDAWARYCAQPVGAAKVVRPQFGGRS
jgi:integrase